MGLLLFLWLFSLCESARVAVSDRSTRDCPYKNYGGPCPSCASPITAPPGVAPLIDPWKVPVDPDEYAQSIRAASDRACPVEFSRDDDFSGGGERISGVRYWVVSPNATVTNPSYGFQYASASRKRAMWEQTFQKSLMNPRQAAEYLEVGVLADGLLTDCTLHVYNVTGTQQSFCVQASSLIPWWFYIYNESARATDNVTSEYLGILQFDRSDPQQRFYEDAPGGYDVYMFRGAWFPRKLDFRVFQFVNRVRNATRCNCIISAAPTSFGITRNSVSVRSRRRITSSATRRSFCRTNGFGTAFLVSAFGSINQTNSAFRAFRLIKADSIRIHRFLGARKHLIGSLTFQ